jgi:hypothetical protein
MDLHWIWSAGIITGSRWAKLPPKRSDEMNLFWNAGCSLWRIRSFSFSLDFLHGGLPIGINIYFNFWFKEIFSHCQIFYSFWPPNPWIRIRVQNRIRIGSRTGPGFGSGNRFGSGTGSGSVSSLNPWSGSHRVQIHHVVRFKANLQGKMTNTTPIPNRLKSVEFRPILDEREQIKLFCFIQY